MKDYQTVILLVYPRLERLIFDIGQMAEAKAYASYNGRETAEKCVEKILEYMHVRDCFAALQGMTEDILAELTREERYLLEYKYFRRRRMLDGEFADIRMPYCERTYYRRQRRLAGRLNSLFLQHGADETWFLRLFSEIPYMMSALENVQRRGVSELTDKRTKKSLRLESPAG